MVQHADINHSGLTGVVSFGSNSNSVAISNAPGASPSNSHADHVHLGVTSVAHTSNTFSGPVTVVAGANIGITSPTSGTLTISGAAAGGGGGGATAEFTTAAASVATNETTTSGSFVDLATVGPSVTVTIGASGKAMLHIVAQMRNNTANNACYVAIVISGATTVAADQKIEFHQPLTSAGSRIGISIMITGLNAGSTTFKMQYAAGGGTAANFANRELTVAPVFGV